jgi:hypothetical protein
MAAPPDVVLVYSPEEAKRRSITTALRDRWSVRTAASPEAAISSLDETIAVVVVEGDDSSVVENAVTDGENDNDHTQLLWLGSTGADIATSAEAVLPADSARVNVQDTVDRLHRRARFDRLLTACYELSRARSEAKADESASADDVAAYDRKLDSVQRKLNDLATKLDDVDAFDVALNE